MSVVTLRSERSPLSDIARASPVFFERCDGACELRFARRDGVTSLAHLFQRAPCRVLFPNSPADDLTLAALLTTSGGLAGGDRVRISVGAEEGAQAVVTTQAAEKIYRSLGPDTRIDIALTVGPDAWLEWLPQETILFDRARLARRTTAEIEPGGRLLAAEMIVFGRTARGERLSAGLLHDRWSVRVAGRLVWVDALRLEGDIASRLDAPAGFDGATATATAIYAGADAASLLPLARALALDSDSRAGATLVDGILLARFIGRDARVLRADLARYLGDLRRAAAGLPARVPRLWQC
ncbi:MAG TPA: urease accessory protein UreD [Stellaceae bacterium]|jgi:urease accessory protein|nr:urease accessory protein UreD [Stellaceae bacterium]